MRSSAWRIRQMRELGFAVLAIDYRGFGRSSTNGVGQRRYRDALRELYGLGA